MCVPHFCPRREKTKKTSPGIRALQFPFFRFLCLNFSFPQRNEKDKKARFLNRKSFHLFPPFLTPSSSPSLQEVFRFITYVVSHIKGKYKKMAGIFLVKCLLFFGGDLIYGMLQVVPCYTSSSPFILPATFWAWKMSTRVVAASAHIFPTSYLRCRITKKKLSFCFIVSRTFISRTLYSSGARRANSLTWVSRSKNCTKKKRKRVCVWRGGGGQCQAERRRMVSKIILGRREKRNIAA